MLERLDTRCLLRPNDIPPSDDRMKVVSAFNPGGVDTPDGVVLLVRVAEAVKEHRPGFYGLPRFVEGELVIDWVPENRIQPIDPRVVRVMPEGVVRLTFFSYLLVVRCGEGLEVESIGPERFMPQASMESYGVEDPRITKIDDTYWFTYVAVSSHGACTALGSTRDFETFERHGVIFAPENKDVVLFPERIDGKYVSLHRPNPHQHFAPPEMWIATSPDMINWGENEVFLSGGFGGGGWDIGRIGGGTPPIRTDEGWMTIYHGNSRKADAPLEDIGVYTAATLLLDAQDPRRIIARSRGPIMTPEADFETAGFVKDVVFPTAICDRGDRYFVYYGAADAVTGVVVYGKQALLTTMEAV